MTGVSGWMIHRIALETRSGLVGAVLMARTKAGTEVFGARATRWIVVRGMLLVFLYWVVTWRLVLKIASIGI